jgi:hypothetical protein
MNNGPGTPTRQAQPVPPSVVISPSAPVCLLACRPVSFVKSPLLMSRKRPSEVNHVAACPAPRCRGDDAW